MFVKSRKMFIKSSSKNARSFEEESFLAFPMPYIRPCASISSPVRHPHKNSLRGRGRSCEVASAEDALRREKRARPSGGALADLPGGGQARKIGEDSVANA